ncbi:hypothetical protein BUALT_Bualt04G0103900 [Buddleja alternifolia]|uniref:ACB domain-containing protein n=1 Tax=Buddleja alternifolia TaxID=168488 RepID=A0AAV6XMV4_9LAMI|nr:hypothetical protein BUALT_Bualt04G0103900 [Buddleja alternifolia]
MDAVNILILCVVGLCVVVAYILDILEGNRKNCHESSDQRSSKTVKTRIDDDDDHEEREIVGAVWESEKQIITDNIDENPVFGEIKEDGNQVHASCEESDLCSGLLGISGNSKGNMGISGKSEGNMGISGNSEGSMGICEGEEEDFDDWEGIERSELEKVFGEGVVFMSNYKSNNNGDKIDEDLKLQLYGLSKVVLEGTCHESQPMAFNFSARSKWDAWQKLGNMSREMAMEKYVDILSKAIPWWKSGEGTEAIKDATSS